MDVCFNIFNPYTLNQNDPIKPSFKPLLDYHNKIISTFSALPQQGRLNEVVSRILRLIAAPFAYLVLGLYAICGSCTKGTTYCHPGPDLTKPSLIEETFINHKALFNFSGPQATMQNWPLQKMYLTFEINHKEKGALLQKSLFLDPAEWKQPFSKLHARLSENEHIENRQLVTGKLNKIMDNIEIPNDVRDTYRRLPNSEIDKITYIFTAVCQDTRGEFHKTTFFGDKSLKYNPGQQFQSSSFTDPAQLDESMRAYFMDA